MLDFNDAPSGHAGPPIEPDRELLAVYFKVVFGYLDGLFPFRGFVDQGQDTNGKPYNEWINIEREDAANVIFNMASYCAANGIAAYCIPGTVAEHGQAKADDVLQTQVLVADIDVGNIAQKLAHAAKYLQTPTLIIESGGRTEDGQDKLHVYWKLTEPAGGEDLETVRRLRHELAVKIGADTHFQSMHQPIRIPGSVYHKHQRTRLVTIRAHNPLEYDLSDLSERLGEMPALTSHGGSELDFNTASRGTRDLDELQSMLEKTKEPGHWHDNMRDVVASLVGKSWTDTQIKKLCGPYCNSSGSDPDLIALIISAREKWDTPSPAETPPKAALEPLGDPFGKLAAPPLPPGLLPAVIDAYADREARAKGVVFHAPAMAALTVCAAAIPDDVCLRVKVHEPWHERARFWLAMIGPPSAKKSPVVRGAMSPLKRLEKQAYAQWRQLKADWEKADKDSRGEEPTPHRYILNDTTIEAAGKLLAENPQGMLLERDELAGWFGAMDKYSSGKGAAADRAFWLQAWNGGPYAVDRVSRTSTYILNLSVSILGGIQPDAIRRVAAETVDDGLLQRLVPITVGSANVGEDSPDLGHAFKEYDALIARLSKLQPQVLKFNAAAQEVRRAFERHTHQLANLEILSPQLAAFCGKLDGLFARIALTFHCCESQPPTEHVSEETASRVARLMKDFIIPHAMRFYLEIAGETGTMASARSIAGYILAKRVDRLTFGILTRDCWPCRGRSRDEVVHMLEPLEMFGWLTADNPIVPRAWIVRPDVHEKFAEQASQERERRETVRTVLQHVTSAKE